MSNKDNSPEYCDKCGGKIVSQEIPDSLRWREKRTKYQLLCTGCGEKIRIEIEKKPGKTSRII